MGVDSLSLSATDMQILSLALSDILPTAIFNITSSTLLLSTNNALLPRLLSMFTSSSSMRVAVEFELSVVAEDFGFDGRRYDDLTALLSVIDSLLSTAFSVGTYDASISSMTISLCQAFAFTVAARLRQRVVLQAALCSLQALCCLRLCSHLLSLFSANLVPLVLSNRMLMHRPL